MFDPQARAVRTFAVIVVQHFEHFAVGYNVSRSVSTETKKRALLDSKILVV